MNVLDHSSAVPLYVQLAELIQKQISVGDLTYGDQIMSEALLSEHYGVSRITVRKAIDQLVQNNTLFRKQGKGTFVTPPAFLEDACKSDQSFTTDCFNKDVIPYTTIIEKRIISVDGPLKEKLSLEEDKELIRITRLRALDSVPAIYEEDYFPMAYRALLDMELTNHSLYGILYGKLGIQPAHFSDYFDIVYAGGDHVRHLNVPVGHPLLSVVQTVSDENHQVIYYNEQTIRTDVYRYGVRSY